MNPTCRTLIALFIAGAAAACIPEDMERVDQGAVSVAEGSAEGSIEVTVFLDACLSSSCDTDRVASCTAELDGDRVVVHSNFQWSSGGQSACTDDCGSLAATCTLDAPLPDGSYTVAHGDDEATFTVADGTFEPLCFGDNSPFACNML